MNRQQGILHLEDANSTLASSPVATLNSQGILHLDHNITSSPIQIAAIFNARGITCLDSGDFKQAYCMFSSSLAVVKQAIADLDDIDEDDDAMDMEVAPSICSFHQSQAPPKPNKLLSKKYTEDQMEASEEDDSSYSFVFQHPMAIVDTAAMMFHQQGQQVSYSHYIELSFMQLYNLALCHHLSALSDDDRSSSASFEKKLLKALSLYELAYTIMLTEGDNMQQPTGSVLATMAIVNNLGHIHATLGNVDCSKQCFQNLLSTIMFVKDYGGEENVDQMDGFLSNVIHLMMNRNDNNNNTYNSSSIITTTAAAA